MTQMWDAIIKEFIKGFPEGGPTKDESYLIDMFLNSRRYEQVMKTYYEQEIINITDRVRKVNFIFRKKVHLITIHTCVMLIYESYLLFNVNFFSIHLANI